MFPPNYVQSSMIRELCTGQPVLELITSGNMQRSQKIPPTCKTVGYYCTIRVLLA
jgi:hypothetical protein